jgi:hypothetical protein
LSETDSRYGVSDFMNVTSLLMTLKGVRMESFTVAKGEPP